MFSAALIVTSRLLFRRVNSAVKVMPTYPEQPITPVGEEQIRVTVPADEPEAEAVQLDQEVVSPNEMEELAPQVEEIPELYADEIIEEAGEVVSNFIPDDPDEE